MDKCRKMMMGLVVLLLWAPGISCLAQDSETLSKGMIAPLKLGIAYNQTTNLVFPFAIKSVDRGSREVLVQKAKGLDNILQVKAAKEDFEPTNLTVVTGEGALYSFLLAFREHPQVLNLKIADMKLPYEPVAIITGERNEALLEQTAERVSVKQRALKHVNDGKFDIEMSLNDIFIHDDILYFQIGLKNSSAIRYDIDQLRFYIQDKKQAKRTASQELEQIPLFIYGNKMAIEGQSSQILVVALDKFTVPDKKELVVQLMERNGGRHLEINVTNKHIIKAGLL